MQSVGAQERSEFLVDEPHREGKKIGVLQTSLDACRIATFPSTARSFQGRPWKTISLGLPRPTMSVTPGS